MAFRNATRVFFVVFSLLLAGYGGYWLYARGVAEEIVLNWIADQRAAGYQIEHAPITFDGFPFLIRATLKNPLVAPESEPWAWRGGAVIVEAQPWSLDQIRGEIIGGQTFTLAQDGGRPPERFTLSGETVLLAHLQNGRLNALDLTARNFELRGGGKMLLKGLELWTSATAPASPPRNHLDPLVLVRVSGANLQTTTGFAPFGDTIEKISAAATVRGIAQPGHPATAIDAWRREGGAIDVGILRVVWGPLDLKTSGTVTLDEQMRPLGAFTAEIRNFTHVMDALVAGKMIEAGVAAMAKIGLGLLAKPARDGGAPILTIPLSAQDGNLYAGPLRILKLSPLPIPLRSP